MTKSVIGLVAVAAAAFATQAQATTIDFESTPSGTYNNLVIGGVTTTFTSGTGNFEVQTQNPGAPLAGQMLISYFANPGTGAFKAEFSQSGVLNVSIDVGDYHPSDDDDVHLAAYDANDVLLAFDDELISASGPNTTLSLTAGSAISYVLFWETGSFAGAIYWDNLTFDGRVPEPAMLGLFGCGLMALGAARRRKTVAK